MPASGSIGRSMERVTSWFARTLTRRYAVQLSLVGSEDAMAGVLRQMVVFSRPMDV